MHARVCTCVPLSEQRGKECGRGVYNQTNVRPVKYLETQLNDITAISFARERSVLQLIFVMVSVLFKTTEEELVSKGC